MILQMLGDLERIVAMTLHPEAERLQPLENQKRAVGCERGAGVAQRSDARTPDEGGRPQGLGVDDAVIGRVGLVEDREAVLVGDPVRSEEHTSELQSLMRISYAVFCLKKKNRTTQQHRKSE